MSEAEKDMTQSDERKRGRVKWYNERRGYGFIEVDGHEVFIHRSALQQFGIVRIQNEDIVIVTQVKTERGYIVQHLFGIERPPLPDALYATTLEDGEKVALVKFFNESKGYGFIMVEGYGDDIFIHSRTLEQNRIAHLDSGQKVLVKVSDAEDAPTIETIRFYTGTDTSALFANLTMGQDDSDNRGTDELEEGEAITLDSGTAASARKAFYDLTNEKP